MGDSTDTMEGFEALTADTLYTVKSVTGDVVALAYTDGSRHRHRVPACFSGKVAEAGLSRPFGLKYTGHDTVAQQHVYTLFATLVPANLEQLYFSSQGYVGMNAFARMVRAQYPEYLVKDIISWYKGNVVNQVLSTVRPVKEFRHFDVSGPNVLHQMDLCEMSDDGGYHYYLSVIDVFSRFLAAAPLMTKHAEVVCAALATVYETSEFLDYPKTTYADGGKEFDNKTVKGLLEEHGTQVKFYSDDKRKLSIVERSHRTIVGALYKRQTVRELETGTDCVQWTDILGGVVDAYNSRRHGTIRCKPIEAMATGVVHTKWRDVVQRPMIPLGATVRVAAVKRRDARSTDEKWTRDVYMVCDVMPGDAKNPHVYRLSLNEAELAGTFYREELQVV